MGRGEAQPGSSSRQHPGLTAAAALCDGAAAAGCAAGGRPGSTAAAACTGGPIAAAAAVQRPGLPHGELTQQVAAGTPWQLCTAAADVSSTRPEPCLPGIRA